ncbi:MULTISPECIES: hypothetical protein [Streptacidiphilus]|uniref:DUF3592 domain-containing protein n=1 Tax=Streptacidiphilus cavernicola TaxID=3342716 RepID=A0ABV6UVQ6_9ACTN|nr:hypothetical protein [Streptacidiphilus jeojiense]
MATPAAAPTPAQPAPRRSRLGIALARRHNPLWRRTDALRARLRMLLIAALIVITALAALLALGLYRSDRAAAGRYAATLHRVQAVALADADQQHPVDGARFTAEVRWTDASGAHQARAAAGATTLRGDPVTVWVDAAGSPSSAPRSEAYSTGKAAMVGSLVWISVTSGALAVATLRRRRLGQVDLERWTREWEDVEPVWTRRGQGGAGR